jgi:glycerol-3-phosphate dehydrogenase (NAD(P)+)
MRRAERAAELAARRENSRSLPGVPLPREVVPTSSLEEALRGAAVVILAVPAQTVRALARLLVPILPGQIPVVNAAKGLEVASCLRLSEVLAAELGVDRQVAAISGPNLAPEIARGLPAAATLACADLAVAERLQATLATSTYRLYASTDLVGVELGGSVKNVIAIAAGICDGLGLGDNAAAAIVTRGLAEISRLGVAAGARPLTFAGLSGLGDLVATCGSRLSRNHRVGVALARGEPLARIEAELSMVAEGVPTARALRTLAARYGVEMPISAQVHSVLFEGKAAPQAVDELMSRAMAREVADSP